MIYELSLVFFLGYLLGSIPTAYLIWKWMSGADIRDAGTGNVGARNIYDVSGKKWPGVVTLLIDAGKGALAVTLSAWIFPESFSVIFFAGVGAVIGHNYNFLLKGKGGRGLATAFGASLVVNPILPFTWIVMYFMGFYVIKRDVHVGSMTAILATAVLMFSLPDLAMADPALVPFESVMQIRIYGVAILFPLFLKHLDPIRELIRASREEEQTEDEEDA